ncbi:MAG: ABC transporter permease [Deltaproteobacteria bacterium]|jgi:phospholipid/cholesterol/gamma-HCH transport system permease protein|nr:ABC transporter permease [Deltaproteobacteria bacterium]MBW2487384.1 ABC transporter permease [Deltaproteobacteria bacterium]
MQLAKENIAEACELSFEKTAEDTLLVRLKGSWTIDQQLPSVKEIGRQVESDAAIKQIAFDTAALSDWDSGLLSFLTKIITDSSAKNITVNQEGLSEGIQKLLKLAFAVPERKGARKEALREPLLDRIGASTIAVGQASVDTLGFIGEAFLALLKFFVGKARFQRSELMLTIQQCGVQALPIVSLISVLVGLIFAFIGAVQLMMFGAQIFVADLVAIAMTRVMGAVMVGVIMAGRTGAAFAAQIGTMQVNEEIDALQTLGISPMEFLVLPRMLALILMMPLLVVYADLMGILGGFIVGVGMLDITVKQYINQTINAMNLYHFFIGIIHALVFGVLVALAGCLRGIQCGRSASAVGQATTSAVVTSIVAIVVATAVITVVCNLLGV